MLVCFFFLKKKKGATIRDKILTAVKEKARPVDTHAHNTTRADSLGTCNDPPKDSQRNFLFFFEKSSRFGQTTTHQSDALVNWNNEWLTGGVLEPTGRLLELLAVCCCYGPKDSKNDDATIDVSERCRQSGECTPLNVAVSAQTLCSGRTHGPSALGAKFKSVRLVRLWFSLEKEK